MNKKKKLALLLAFVAFLVCMILVLIAAAFQIAFKELRDAVLDAKKEIEGRVSSQSLEKAIKEETQNMINRIQRGDPVLSQYWVPTGTIIHFASAKKPDDLVKEGGELYGYLYCDGKVYDGADERYKKLFDLIGDAWGQLSQQEIDKYTSNKNENMGRPFKIPDLRGYFLRASDAQTPVGTPEDWETAMPRSPRAFTISTSGGKHTHETIKGEGSHEHGKAKKPDDYGGMRTTKHGEDRTLSPRGRDRGGSGDEADLLYNVQIGGGAHHHSIPLSGAHGHSITGGDTETRPKNKRVAFFIKL